MVTRRRKLTWVLGVGLLLVLLGGVVFWARPVDVFRVATEIRFRLSGAESRWITVEGYRIHYYLSGPDAGPVVVLVHGLGGRSEDWVNLAPYLSRAGYRVYMPDLPGFGHSEQPANFSYSVPDQAAFVAAFMDAVGLKQVDLGGWSMGGWIVQVVAAEHPDRVRKLMLFDSAGLYIKLDWDTSLFTPTTASQLEQLDALLMPHPPKLPGFVARDILRVSERNAWVVHRAMDSMLTGRDTTDNILPELKMPVLIVWGEEDRATPLSMGQKIHALIPQSQLEVFAGCGHLAPNQCAGEIGPKVVGFLKP
jgi:pimeloyl-ACP methyl ester carboxylesterase